MLRTRPLLAAALALVASCKSSESNGPIGLSGTLSFTYSGGISGTFNVSGQMPTSQVTMETTSWAAGESGTGFVFVVAATPRNATSHDYLTLELERNTVGSSTIGSGCGSNCAFVDAAFGAVNTGTGGTFLQNCFLLTGTVTITEISATRVKGTFSGTGTCLGPPPGSASTSFTITGGTFDVALVSGIP